MKRRHCDIDIVEKKGLFNRIATIAQVNMSLFVIFYASIMGSVYFQMVWLPFVYFYQPIQLFVCEIMMGAWFNLSAVSILVFSNTGAPNLRPANVFAGGNI